jgi:hypothetical protein
MFSSQAARQRFVLLLVSIVVLTVAGPFAGAAFASLPPAGGGGGPSQHSETASQHAAVPPPKAARPATQSIGYDISWPQCPQDQKPSGSVNWVILGVTGGKPTTLNPCLPQQAAWAKTAGTLPQLDMNVAGVPAGYDSPLCAASDTPCQAYQFGANSAASSLRYAAESGVTASNWWLDVETGNYWTSDHFLNERVIAGAIETLQSTGHNVGIYSTPLQWSIIAGGFAPKLNVWTAGAEDVYDAAARCNPKYSFGGGLVALVQYVSEEFDMSYVCPFVVPTHSVTVSGVSN